MLKQDNLYNDIRTLIISTHGEEGKIIMPKLADEVYETEEPKIDFGQSEIIKYGNLQDFLVVTTGCTLDKLSDCFKQIGCKNYIAPDEYIEGNSALIFVTTFFYELSKNTPLDLAFTKAQKIDEETEHFKIR